MTAYVVVHIGKSGKLRAREAHAFLSTARPQRLIADHDGVVLAPSEADDAETSPVATISVPEMAKADSLAAALRGIDGIETAYAKPGDELP